MLTIILLYILEMHITHCISANVSAFLFVDSKYQMLQ